MEQADFCQNKIESTNLPPMPSIPPPLPPIPNGLPPLPDVDDEGIDDNENSEGYSKQSLLCEEDEIGANNQILDAVSGSRNIQDADGRSGVYTGETLFDSSSQSDLPHGHSGIMLYDDGKQDKRDMPDGLKPVKYSGEWMLGHWHGVGSLTFTSGDSYSGQFRTSNKHGQGTYIWADGRQYNGNFDNDFRHGQGTYTWPTEGEEVIRYTGTFERNQRNGFGTYIDEVAGVEYTGEWENGLYQGYGIYQWNSESFTNQRHAYRGNFQNGRPNGQGVEILPDGSVRHEGLWQDGDPILTVADERAQQTIRQRTNAEIVSGQKAANLLNSSSAVRLPARSHSHGENDLQVGLAETVRNHLGQLKNTEEDVRHSASATIKRKKKKDKTGTNITVVESQKWKDTTTGCNCVYRGLWDAIKSCPEGNGTAMYATGAVQSYEGQMKAGLYHGQGRLWYRNGDLYEGTFVAGQRHTSGEKDPITGKNITALYRWKDGRQYNGQFYCNARQGHGILVYANQDLYEGDFVAGQREGYGRFVFALDGSCYTGLWQSGHYHGDGTLVMGNGFTYVGQFQNGYEHGLGCLRDSTGHIIYDGEWIGGKRRDEVDAAVKILQNEANQKRAAVEEALAELDKLSISKDTAPSDNPMTTTNTVLRDWKHKDKFEQKRSGMGKRNTQVEANTDTRPCEAVVNEPVTDLLGCPGYFTGIVDSQTRLPHGVGRLVYADGKRIHEGFWKDGSKDGHGRCLFFPQSDFHEGEYKNNLRHGPGRYHWQDGRSFTGFYENDLRHGQGVFVYPGGERYEGNFSKGQRSGFGRFEFVDPVNNDRQGYYEGAWENGLYHGAGHIVWGDGVSFTGHFAAGTFHGKGTKRYATGNIIRDGFWKHGVACDEEDFEERQSQKAIGSLDCPTETIDSENQDKPTASIDEIDRNTSLKQLDHEPEEKKTEHEDESAAHAVDTEKLPSDSIPTFPESKDDAITGDVEGGLVVLNGNTTLAEMKSLDSIENENLH